MLPASHRFTFPATCCELVLRSIDPRSGLLAAPAYQASMRQALASVHTFFVIPVHESPDRVEQYVATVDAAVAAGVERIVYSSFVGAAPDATFTFARDYWHTEEHIRKSGLDFTFLRTSTWTFSPGSWAPTASSAPLPVIDGSPRWHVTMWLAGLWLQRSRV